MTSLEIQLDLRMNEQDSKDFAEKIRKMILEIPEHDTFPVRVNLTSKEGETLMLEW